ncbi:hypothetical protein V1477_013712 [Vespula maculifrons]|uniref:Uncharacterized protein n=1 Tax=Vespula maculifrons TaxID=7453 RepID=A0ABD2BPC3_VESMC
MDKNKLDFKKILVIRILIINSSSNIIRHDLYWELEKLIFNIVQETEKNLYSFSLKTFHDTEFLLGKTTKIDVKS